MATSFIWGSLFYLLLYIAQWKGKDHYAQFAAAVRFIFQDETAVIQDCVSGFLSFT